MADHAKSEGARYERAAMRNRLRRQIKKAIMADEQKLLQTELDWVLGRQKRYDPRPGGLGR